MTYSNVIFFFTNIHSLNLYKIYTNEHCTQLPLPTHISMSTTLLYNNVNQYTHGVYNNMHMYLCILNENTKEIQKYRITEN